ncbi:hypothetical protein Lal_00018841 [Lupinus albus]|nr:hypothetical protein Lal_00018841 [Lupinus albus]
METFLSLSTVPIFWIYDFKVLELGKHDKAWVQGFKFGPSTAIEADMSSYDKEVTFFLLVAIWVLGPLRLVCKFGLEGKERKEPAWES